MKSIENAKTLLKEIEDLRQEQRIDIANESKEEDPRNMEIVEYVVANDKSSSLSDVKEVAAKIQSFYLI